MARAVFAPVELVGATASTVTLRVPGSMPRAKCEAHRPTVESALSEFAGHPLVVEFVDDDGSGPRPDDDPGRDDPAAPPAPLAADLLPADDEVDLDDLIDAAPTSVRSPIDRLAEAFPGSELIEEVG